MVSKLFLVLAMKLLVLASLFFLSASAAITVTVPSNGVTQMQALLQIVGAAGACTIEVSTSASYMPLVRDFDPASHTSSNVDTSRPDTITHANGDKLVTIGHAFQDRALAPATTYYYRVSVCGAATGSFTTTTVPVGATQQFPIPVDRTAWANRGNNLSLADLKAGNGMNDSITGVPIHPASGLTDASWTWPDNHVPIDFPYWDKGTGWSNPGSARLGASSTASTSTGNPLDLYYGRFDQDTWADNAYFGRAILDIAFKAYGSGTTAHACIFFEPADPCVSTGFNINMTGSSGMNNVPSASTRPNHSWPASFPAAIFAGWGMTDLNNAEHRLRYGTLAAVSGTVTLDGVYYVSAFPSVIKTGHKIYIAGSASLSPACVNNMCTIDHVVDAQHAVLSEAIAVPTGTAYTLMGFGIRITNTQPGTMMNFGAAWEVAGSIMTGSTYTAGGLKCAGGPGFDSGHTPPKKLKWCMVGTQGDQSAYLLGEDGWNKQLVGRLEGIPPNSYFTDQLGWNINDAPCKAPACVLVGHSEGWIYWNGFTPLDARTFFLSGPANTGQAAFWKITYMGDGTEDRDLNYSMTMSGSNGGWGIKYQLGGSGTTATWDKLHWELLLTGSSSLGVQIPALFPGYRTDFYGMNFRFNGVSGHIAFFENDFSGLAQDGGCALAMVDLTDGVLKALVNTATGEGVPNDGSGIFNGGIYGGCHNTTTQTKLPNTASTSLHVNAYSNTSLTVGGPFIVTPQAIKRGGVWDSSICMTWPWNDTTWCQGVAVPDTDCSVLAAGSPYLNIHGLPAARQHDCLAVRVPHGGLCSPSPKSVDAPFAFTWHTAGTPPDTVAARLAAGSTPFVGTGAHTWTVIIDGNDPGSGTTRGTFKWKQDNGSFTTNVPITGTGDMLLSSNFSVRWPWGAAADAVIGDQWVISTSAVQERSLGTCPWNSTYSKVVPDRLGQTLMEYSDTGIYDEVLRVIKITEGTNGGLSDDWVLQRNAVSDYNCVMPGPFDVSTCVNDTNQARHPHRGVLSYQGDYCQTHTCLFSDSWVLVGVPDGMQGGWGTNVFWNLTPTGLVPQSIGGVAAGHGSASNVGGGLYTFATAAGAMTPKTLDNLFAVPPALTSISFGGPLFHGIGPNIGGGSVQAYFDLVEGRPTGMDYNSMADNGGGNTLAPRDMTATATAGIWKIEMIGSLADPKLYFPHGWAGEYLLEDVSGPEHPSSGPATALSALFSYCIPLHDGECYAGSTIAERGANGNKIAYANVPKGWNPDGRCHGFYMWADIPCIVQGWPGIGAVREQGITRNSAGNNSRILSYVNTIPGETRSYSELVPTGTNSGWVTPNFVQGLYQTGWLITVPSWYDTPSTVADDVINVPITVSAGNAYADIEFGYSRFGTPSQFRCHTRQEGCSTSGTPYAFASENKTYRSDCASGCLINIPAMAGNVVYYRVNRSTNGTTWTNGEIQSLAISGVVVGPCVDLTFSPTSASVTTGGGTGTFNATVTDSSCDRSITSSAPSWLTCTANCTGSGSVTGIGYNAVTNVGGPARSATLTGGGQAFTVNQSGTVVCTYSIAPISHTYPVAGEAQAVTVTTSDLSCAWTATYPGGWLIGITSGTGTQTFDVVAPPNAGSDRTTAATIAGRSYAATQDGVAGGTNTMISGGMAITGGVSIH